MPRTYKNVDVAPKPTRNLAATGVSLDTYWSHQFDNCWEVLSSDEVTPAQLDLMRRTDGQARGLYSIITMPILAALRGSSFTMPHGVLGGDRETKFITDMFTLPASRGGMSVPFSRFIAQMSLALSNHFSAFEFEYKMPKSGPLAGKWVVDRFGFRPASTITFLVDDSGKFEGFRQRIHRHGEYLDVHIPGDHSFYYAAREEEREFYGRSYFEAAYRVWENKFKLYQIMHMAAMRAATGTRVGKVRPNSTAAEFNSFQRALNDIAFASSIIVPEGFEVDVLREMSSFDFLAYLNHYNNQMSKSVLAQFMDESQGTGGDTAVVKFGGQSDTHFMLSLRQIQNEMANVINTKIIPRFIDWNFGSGKYPEFHWGPLNDSERALVNDTFKTLFQGAVDGRGATREFMFGLEQKQAAELGMNIDYDDIKRRKLAEWEREDSLAPETHATDRAELGARQTAAFQQTEEANTATVKAAQSRPIHEFDIYGLALPEGFALSAPARVVKDAKGSAYFGQPVGSVVRSDRSVGSKKPTAGAKTTQPAQPQEQMVDEGEAVLRSPGDNLVFLVQYPDGTLALRFPDGRESTRRMFPIEEFTKLGWTPLHDATDEGGVQE